MCSSTPSVRAVFVIALAAVVAGPSSAQAPFDPSFDLLAAPVRVQGSGEWTGNVGLGLTLTSGNTSSTQLSANAEATRTTDSRRWILRGLIIRNRSEGITSADNARGTVRHEWDMTQRWFSFGEAAFERDAVQDLSLRQSYSLGLGQRVFDGPRTSLNFYAGVAYTLIDRTVADDDRGVEALVGNDFEYDLSEHTMLTQRLILFPHTVGGGRRAVLEAGIHTRLVGAFGLQITYLHRYTTDVPADRGRTDRTLFTGVTANF